MPESEVRRSSLGSISSGACLLTVTILMVWSPFVSLSFAVLVAYGVTSRSAWDKRPATRWRWGVVVSWIGYLVTVSAVFLWILAVLAAEGSAPMFSGLLPGWGVPLVLSVSLGGVALLPLSVFTTLDTIRQRRRIALQR